MSNASDHSPLNYHHCKDILDMCQDGLYSVFDYGDPVPVCKQRDASYASLSLLKTVNRQE